MAPFSSALYLSERDARELKYGVYTRVSDYRDWIARTIAANKR